MELTIHFAGLCAFSPVEYAIPGGTISGFRVTMVPGHNNHRPVLTVPLADKNKAINLARTTWRPDLISYTTQRNVLGATSLVQVATWYLDGLTLELDVAPDTVNGKADAFPFAKYHKSSTTLPPADVIAAHPATAIFEITEGKLSSPKGNQFKVHQQDTKKYLGTENVAPSVRLKTSATIVRRDKFRVISFMDGAEAIVSNLAPVASSDNAHFHHYYDVMSLGGADKPVYIANSHDPFYDCVPPGTTP
jgi:hypothetical protein